MRSIILTLALATAIPMLPGTAMATSHDCQQLRSTVRNSVPLGIRNLPYDALDCAAIGEIHLLNGSYSHNHGLLTQRIEAVFRREGLIR